MPFIAATDAPQFDLHGATFTGLASPSRGAAANSVWLVTLSDTAQAVTHTLSAEETIVCIEGRALATLGDGQHELTPGSAIVIPPDVPFSLRNPHAAPFRGVAIMPVGAQACVSGQPPFTPPWTR